MKSTAIMRHRKPIGVSPEVVEKKKPVKIEKIPTMDELMQFLEDDANFS